MRIGFRFKEHVQINDTLSCFRTFLYFIDSNISPEASSKVLFMMCRRHSRSAILRRSSAVGGVSWFSVASQYAYEDCAACSIWSSFSVANSFCFPMKWSKKPRYDQNKRVTQKCPVIAHPQRVKLRTSARSISFSPPSLVNGTGASRTAWISSREYPQSPSNFITILLVVVVVVVVLVVLVVLVVVIVWSVVAIIAQVGWQFVSESPTSLQK